MPDRRLMLITGSRKGIGRYLAEYYLERGYEVVGCSRQSSDLTAGHYHHYSVDVTREAEVRKLMAEIWQRHRRLDVLINNAAVNQALALLLMVPYEAAQRTIEVNLLGTFLVCREAIKLMLQNKFGRVVNFSSMAVRHEVRGEAIYAATKAAIITMTRILAKEVYPYGVTCNVVAPAAIDTDLMRGVDAEALSQVLERNAIPTSGKMADVSNAIDFLLKEESRAITGQTIFLGGA